MTACVEDAAVLVNALYIDAQLFFQDVDLVVYGQDGGCYRCAALFARLLGVDILPHLLEYPGMTKGSPSHHHGVYTIVVKGLFRLLRRGDVAIANDWDMDTWVVFHCFYQCPVSIAGIHLAARASVDRQRLYAAVLQLLSQVLDDQVSFVPSQPRLYRYRRFHGFDDLFCDVEQERDVFEHSCSGAFSGHLFHRASKVDVDDVGVHRFHDFSRLDHRVNVFAIDLNTYRPLLIIDVHLVECGLDAADDCVGRDKLSINHSRAKPFAEHTEAYVRHVFHGSEEERTFTKVNVSYLHI